MLGSRPHWFGLDSRAAVRLVFLVGLALAGATMLATTSPASVQAVSTTLTVNSNGDGSDNNIGNDVCDDGSGNCTLRAALEEAASAGSDVTKIHFDLDAVGGAVLVDCTNNGNLPSIVNDGLTVDTQTDDVLVTPISDCSSSIAFEVEASDVTLRGLQIVGDPDSLQHFLNGIYFTSNSSGGTVEAGDSNCVLGGTIDFNALIVINGKDVTVQDCFLGVDKEFNDLGTDNSERTPGVETRDSAAGDIVIRRNTFGFLCDDVNLDNATTHGVTITIRDNFIGSDASGKKDLGGDCDGVDGNLDPGPGNVPVVLIANNLIANKDDRGVELDGRGKFTVSGNIIRDNHSNGLVAEEDLVGTILLSQNVFGNNEEQGIDENDGPELASCGNGDGPVPPVNGQMVCARITKIDSASATVSGTVDLQTCPRTSCTVELFSAKADGNGDDFDHGEGVAFVGSTSTIGASGAWSIQVNLRGTVVLTTTASNTKTGTTSEFGKNVSGNIQTNAIADGVFLTKVPGGVELSDKKGAFGGDNVYDTSGKGAGGINVRTTDARNGDGPIIKKGNSLSVPFRIENDGLHADRIKLKSITSSRALTGISIGFRDQISDLPGQRSANDLNVGDATVQLGARDCTPAGCNQLDGNLMIQVGANAAVGKYVVFINLQPNGSSNTAQSDSVTLRFRVQ